MRTKQGWSRALVLLAVLTLVAAGCSKKSGGGGASASGSASATGGTIIHGTTDTIVSLDPAGQYDFGSFQISAQIYNSLLEVQPSGTTADPALATSCDSTDSITYTCHLRPGLTFSDGSALTSEDVVYSFKRNIEINDPAGACSLLSSLAACGKWKDSVMEAPDPQTVVFHLNAPNAVWPFILTTSAAFIVPTSYPETKLQPDGQDIGSGRYTLAQYRPGEQVALEKNPNFWGDPPLNDRVIVQYFTKSSALKLALEQGDVDIGWRTFTPTDIAALKGESGLNVLTGPGGEIRYLAFNTSLDPGKNLAVRQAAAMSIDRQAIVDNVYNGTVQPLWSMIPAGMAGHVDAFKDQYGDAPDPAGAAKVLSDAGISTPVPIEIWWTPTHYGDSSADEYAEIQRALEANGLFKVTLKSTEWDAYTTAAFTDNYPAFQLGWFPDFVDADNYVGFAYASSSYLNDHYTNKKIDALIADERATTDQAQRQKDFEEMQRIAAKDVPNIPVWQGSQVAVVRDGINGVQATLDPTYIFRYWLISKSS